MSRTPAPDDPFREGTEAARARRVRSFGIALLLIAFAVLVFVITLMKLGGRG